MDVNGALALIMAPKDDVEMGLIRKACQCTMDLYSKYLKEQIMEVIDADKVSCRCSDKSKINVMKICPIFVGRIEVY